VVSAVGTVGGSVLGASVSEGFGDRVGVLPELALGLVEPSEQDSSFAPQSK
jgi:hypothetical protein